MDGTDFRQEEKQHPNLPHNNKECSVQFKHCGCKIEIMLSLPGVKMSVDQRAISRWKAWRWHFH
jgi:hypothetical protein